MSEKIMQIIKQDEKIIYFSNSVIGKVNKQTVRILIAFAVLNLFSAILIIGINNHSISVFSISSWIIILMTLLFFILLIYGVIYNFILRDRKIKGNEYIITNKKIIIYNSITDKLLIGDINRINFAMIVREKKNKDGVYGDLTLHVEPKEINLSNIFAQIHNPNPDVNNANNIALSGIKNPGDVLSLIKTYNPNIIIADDRPTFLGKKY